MYSFKPLNTKKYSKLEQSVTSDTVYWNNLSPPVLVKEYHAIDYIDFAPVEPHYFAVTCSLRVQIYNPITKLVVKNLSRFQESAHGGSYRKDGSLLVAGDGEGLVKIFNTTSRQMLRVFRGHTAPVHRTYFLPNNNQIVSFSDDKSVKIWDIVQEAQIQTFNEHKDYIRAGCVSPVSPNIVLSAGYDSQIKMYDLRSNTVCFSINHESPVDSLLFLPSGGIFLSGGGTEIRVWDALKGGRLLEKLSHHSKAVTCLRLASNGRRIVSGSLDRQVKVYDVATYKPVHTFHYTSAVLSVALAKNDKTLVTGTVDGILSIRNMDTESKEKIIAKKPKSRITTDLVVPDYIKSREAKYDHWLRKYEYAKALDEVLKPYVINKNPHITVSVMQELVQRKGLHRAFAARSNTVLATVIRFITKYIGEHRFTNTLMSVAGILLDTYEESFYTFTGEIGSLFIKLSETLKQEVNLAYELLELEGALELILSSANLSSDTEEIFSFMPNESVNIGQSSSAEKELSVIKVH